MNFKLMQGSGQTGSDETTWKTAKHSSITLLYQTKEFDWTNT